jgi:peptidase A4-like protein
MRATAVLLFALLPLAAAPAAQASGTPSANWAGYAVHGTTFERVSGSWRQPRATCGARNRTYSAMWVGLGGYSLTSNDLEQVGTELDCKLNGQVSSSAWYELVPSPSHRITLQVHPGDRINASVRSSGGAVAVSIANVTTHHAFHKTFHPAGLDITSAEWILEAPSACIFGSSACETLPLTDFGQAAFQHARAQATTGHVGTISSSAWHRTKINLTAQGQVFSGDRPGITTLGASATPSALNSFGGSFSVLYRPAHGTRNALLARPRLPAGPTYLRH